MPEKPLLFVGWAGVGWSATLEFPDKGPVAGLRSACRNRTVRQFLSLPSFPSDVLWTTVAASAWPHQHGILDPEIQARNPEGANGPRASAGSRRPAFWQCLSDAGVSCEGIGWPGARCFADARPMDQPFLEECRVSVDEIDPGLLGLFADEPGRVWPDRQREAVHILEALATVYSVHHSALRLLRTPSPPDCLAVCYPLVRELQQRLASPRRKQRTLKDNRFLRTVLTGAAKLQDVLLADLLAHKGDERALLLFGDGCLCPALNTGGGFSGFTAPEAFLVCETDPPVPVRLSLPGVGRRILDHFSVSVPGDDADTVNAPPELRGLNPRETARLTLRMGQSYAAAGVPGQALEHFWAAARLFPEDPAACWAVARMLAQSGLTADALALLGEEGDLGLSTVDERLCRCQLLLLSGDLDRLRLYLREKPFREEEETAATPGWRGLSAFLDGRFSEADAHFRTQIATHPEDPMAWLGVARCALELRQPAAALEAAKRSLALSGEHVLTHTTLAEAERTAGHDDKAVMAMARALCLRPFSRHTRNALVRLFPAASPEAREQTLALLEGLAGTEDLQPSSAPTIRERFQALKRHAGKEPRGDGAGWDFTRGRKVPFPDFHPAPIPETADLSLGLPDAGQLPRVLPFFNKREIGRGTLFPLILTRGPLGRIVGSIALRVRESDPRQGRIFLSVRSGVSSAATLRGLFEQVLSLARMLGVSRLQFIANESFTGQEVLSALGFHENVRHEQWVVPLSTDTFGQKSAAAARIARRARQQGGFIVEALSGGVIPEAARILRHYALLSDVDGGRYEERLSCIARFNGKMAGVLLAEVRGTAVFVQALAADPRLRGRSGLIGALLLNHLVRGLPELPDFSSIRYLHCTVRPDDNIESAQLAKRAGGHLLERYRIFILDKERSELEARGEGTGP